MHGRRSKDAALLGVLKKRPIIDGGVDGGCVAGRHGGEGNKKRKKVMCVCTSGYVQYKTMSGTPPGQQQVFIQCRLLR